MRLPGEETLEAVDGLARKGASFSLYRLPGEGCCRLVLQASGEAERLESAGDLGSRRGFALAPFHVSGECPVLLVRPDATATGWEEIGRALAGTAGGGRPSARGQGRGQAARRAGGDPRRDYAAAFSRFMGALGKGRFQKLVLSRSVSTGLPGGFSPARAFLGACEGDPGTMAYLCHVPAAGTWIGSTPEVLLSGNGDAWRTVAMAGTMPLGGGTPRVWDGKNREEQRLVADFIRGVAGKFGRDVTETGPHAWRAGDLWHLRTDFRFRMDRGAGLGCLLEALHPTPAVCGLPRDGALRFILGNEGHDRSYYSGFIGWLDPGGRTDLYVNIRCMRVGDVEATLYAGGGILPSSDPDSEWEETIWKMETMGRLAGARPH